MKTRNVLTVMVICLFFPVNSNPEEVKEKLERLF